MRGLVVLALCIACSKQGGADPRADVPPPSDEECTAYRNKMFGFLPEDQRLQAAAMGLDKPTPLELKLCKERMVSDEIACAVNAATQDAALACKSAHDIRPADAKRTGDECSALAAHVKQLAETKSTGESFGPPFTPTMAAMVARECDRWMTKKRYACVMKAQGSPDLVGCPM